MWFLGPVTQVGCMAGRQSRLDIDTEDTAAAILRFRSGTIGELHVDYTQRAYQRTFEFFGEEGTLSWSCRDKAVKLFSVRKEPAWIVWDEPAGYDLNHMYLEEVAQFLEAVKAGKPVDCDLRYGVAVLNVILAAERSSDESRFISV
jgi:predicted dehydrogenase